jgi:hypothetical protein
MQKHLRDTVNLSRIVVVVPHTTTASAPRYADRATAQGNEERNPSVSYQAIDAGAL